MEERGSKKKCRGRGVEKGRKYGGVERAVGCMGCWHGLGEDERDEIDKIIIQLR